METQRNYEVVRLQKHVEEDRFTIIIRVDGKEIDSGESPHEWAELHDLEDGGIFGYFDDRERRVLRRGFRPDGTEKTPSGRKRRRDQGAPAQVEAKEPEGEQACRLCGVTKPMTEFSRYARARSGFRNYCKDCTREACKKSKERKA